MRYLKRVNFSVLKYMDFFMNTKIVFCLNLCAIFSLMGMETNQLAIDIQQNQNRKMVIVQDIINKTTNAKYYIDESGPSLFGMSPSKILSFSSWSEQKRNEGFSDYPICIEASSSAKDIQDHHLFFDSSFPAHLKQIYNNNQKYKSRDSYLRLYKYENNQIKDVIYLYLEEKDIQKILDINPWYKHTKTIVIGLAGLVALIYYFNLYSKAMALLGRG